MTKTYLRCTSWQEACRDIDEDPNLQGADQKTKRAALKAIAEVNLNALQEAFLLMDDKAKECTYTGFQILADEALKVL